MALSQVQHKIAENRWSLLVGCLLTGAGLFGSPSSRAGRVDTAHRLLADDKADVARNKCERWDAAQPTAEPLLREACAEAFWPLAIEQDDPQGWASYRATWAQTQMARRAVHEEARAVLRETDPMEDEPWFLQLAEKYSETSTAAEFTRMASNAAVRDVRSGDQAAQVAQRYPNHPGLPGLVERYPEGFLEVQVKGREIKVEIDPPVQIPSEMGPWARWVMWDVQGKQARSWDQAARDQLSAWGVSLTRPPGGEEPSSGKPRIPVCYLPDFPPGETPAIEISVGDGRMYRPIGWDEGCGPDGWPVFLVFAGTRLRAVSLRPGHLVSLDPGPSDLPWDLRRWFTPGEAPPVFEAGMFYQKTGNIWLVAPVSGGAPWVTGRSPSSTALSLTDELRPSGLTSGWRLVPGTSELRVESETLSKMPPALRDWRIPTGEVRTIPPLVQQVLELSSAHMSPPRPPSPVLGANAGWVRTPTGGLDRVPPANAGVAGIYAMEVGEVVASLNVIAALGLGADRVEAFDGWRADLDADRVKEVIIRGLIDGEEMVMVLDPIGEPNPSSAESARLFISQVKGVRSNRNVADTPFTFRKADYLYLAWGAQNNQDSTELETSVVVVRSDGVGFRTEAVSLP